VVVPADLRLRRDVLAALDDLGVELEGGPDGVDYPEVHPSQVQPPADLAEGGEDMLVLPLPPFLIRMSNPNKNHPFAQFTLTTMCTLDRMLSDVVYLIYQKMALPLTKQTVFELSCTVSSKPSPWLRFW
jgi:hypothetical protein